MKRIAVIGLGYVGLPLAVKFSKHYAVLGFDISKARVDELRSGKDSTDEVSEKDLAKAKIRYTTDPSLISKADYIVIAIPTPVRKDKLPDLRPLLSGCEVVGKYMKKGAVVIFESTVYPGCTEDDCIPVLEKKSKLTCGKGFHVAYSPERINPGDTVHTVDKIVKVVGANEPEILNDVAQLYEKIIKAGVHRSPSIRIAEAAKIIENTQRDVNIALMNELQIIFDKMNIDTDEVLKAAGTKWNFNKYHPGLVGGHCIGVDPYYLAYKAKEVGHHPQIILAGRSVNDNMARYVSENIIKDLVRKGNDIPHTKVLILGGAFKPNVPDMRNSKIQDIVDILKDYGCQVAICEPHWPESKLFGVDNVNLSAIEDYDVVIKGVKHTAFSRITPDYTVL